MSGIKLITLPIGNNKDLTFRAKEELELANIIYAEDTRTSGKLLKQYGIETSMFPFHLKNEHAITDTIIERLKSGMRAAF